MRATDQTLFGEPEGNCLAACVASILEVDLASVPNFCDSGDDWWARLHAWLAGRGLWPLSFTSPTAVALAACSGYAIVSGKSERGLLHATVWLAGELVHDPHPSRAGLIAVEDVIVLIPVDLGAWRLAPSQSTRRGPTGSELRRRIERAVHELTGDLETWPHVVRAMDAHLGPALGMGSVERWESMGPVQLEQLAEAVEERAAMAGEARA